MLRSSSSYYNVGYSKDGSKIAQYLPAQLASGKTREKLGLLSSGKNYIYYDENGNKKTSSFVQDSVGNWYYFDKSGNMIKSSNFANVGGSTYFFMSNGVSFRGGLLTKGSKTYYFDKNGKMVKGKRVKSGEYTYTLNKNGYLTSEKYTAASKNQATTKNTLGAAQK